MQISRISTAVPDRINQNNKKTKTQQNNYANNNIDKSKQQVSFKGTIDKFCLGLANLIENGGLAISFTLQDMLGTNLPRPIMGLKRNSKENKGEVNTNFAAKELVREMLTGPSMFVIPGIMLWAGKPIFGKSIDIPMNIIKSLGEIYAANPLIEQKEAAATIKKPFYKNIFSRTSDKTNLQKVAGKKDFYKSAFAEILKRAKSETNPSKETLEKATELAQQLINIPKGSGKKIKAEKKALIENISSEIIDISKKFAKDPAHTDFTVAKLSDTTAVPVKDAISHIMAYADDVVKKATRRSPEKAQDFIKKISNRKILGRFTTNIVMYGTVLAFLQIIPKLYNKAEGKDNAGLKGLMKEETFNNKPEAKEDKPVKDKSNPSFGSSAKAVSTLTGSGIIGKIAHGLEFEGLNLSFPMLLGVMGLGVLLPRTIQAKDKYDREEILRRDLTTCTVMCLGEKELRKGFSKLNEKNSGFVLAAKEKGFENKSFFKRLFDYLRPEKGVRVLSTDQIVSKYSEINKYKDGIKGFCEFIEGQGGNLSKVFSLTDESKTIVQRLLEKEGKDIATADNSTIKEVLSKAIDSDDVKKLTELFEKHDNPWVTKAKTLNARFTALSVLVLVPVFLGFMLPWINEKTTKRKFAEENAKKLSDNINKNNFFMSQNKVPDLFSDIANFTK